MNMGILLLAPDPDAAPFLSAGSYKYGIDYQRASGEKAPTIRPKPWFAPRSVPTGGWKMSKVSGKFVFESVPTADIDAIRARATRAGDPGDAISDFFGDFVDAVESGYETVTSVVFEYGEQAFNAFVEFRDRRGTAVRANSPSMRSPSHSPSFAPSQISSELR